MENIKPPEFKKPEKSYRVIKEFTDGHKATLALTDDLRYAKRKVALEKKLIEAMRKSLYPKVYIQEE